MTINGEFIRNAAAAAGIVITLVSGYTSIKSDIAKLQVQVADVADDLTDLKLEVRNNVAETVFTAVTR